MNISTEDILMNIERAEQSGISYDKFKKIIISRLTNEDIPMSKEEFDEALRLGDFAIGDSFWLDDVEFEVVSKR